MNIALKEVENDVSGELSFDITDKDTGTVVGTLFTSGRYVAYYINSEFREKDIATKALKIITSKIEHPVLEIKCNNTVSKRVAENAGYVLVETSHSIEMYEHLQNTGKVF